jgi:hypothetical protein
MERDDYAASWDRPIDEPARRFLQVVFGPSAEPKPDRRGRSTSIIAPRRNRPTYAAFTMQASGTGLAQESSEAVRS